MMKLFSILKPTVLRLRQWRYPREFRIYSDMESDWIETLGFALSAALDESNRTVIDDNSQPSNIQALDLLNPEFLVSLCNDHFRLKRNASIMAEEVQSSKELRSILRSLKKVDDLLETNGIQCLDLTNEPYDPGRQDFQSLGEAEQEVGIDEQIIRLCECPVILLNGKLIQKARGIVAGPVN